MRLLPAATQAGGGRIGELLSEVSVINLKLYARCSFQTSTSLQRRDSISARYCSGSMAASQELQASPTILTPESVIHTCNLSC